MSEEFLRVARKEIRAELEGLEHILTHCNNDEDVFNNSGAIKGHIHKIKGLAPMMGQEMVGEISKTLDVIIKHVIEKGSLGGSYKFVVEAIESMKNLLSGQKGSDMVYFRKKARKTFPQISEW